MSVPDDSDKDVMGRVYVLYISYDEKRDDFFGMVNIKSEEPIFTIDSTKEMIQYISTGIMKHVDDVEGLEKFLKKQGSMQEHDTLLMSEATLY